MQLLLFEDAFVHFCGSRRHRISGQTRPELRLRTFDNAKVLRLAHETIPRRLSMRYSNVVKHRRRSNVVPHATLWLTNHSSEPSSCLHGTPPSLPNKTSEALQDRTKR